jgi:hypothetical protein
VFLVCTISLFNQVQFSGIYCLAFLIKCIVLVYIALLIVLEVLVIIHKCEAECGKEISIANWF